MVQQRVRAVVRGNVGAQLPQQLGCQFVSVWGGSQPVSQWVVWRTLLPVQVVLFCDIVVGGGRSGVGVGVN